MRLVTVFVVFAAGYCVAEYQDVFLQGIQFLAVYLPEGF
jgi:hypothetical protein